MKCIIHSDFDGLVCGILLTEIFKPDYVVITEPHNIRDGSIKLDKEDVVADLPIPSTEVYMAFDHHSSSSKEKIEGDWFIVDPKAPSCARVIYEEYRGSCPKLLIWKNLVDYCDKIDSANLTLKEYKERNCYNKVSITLKSSDKELDKFYIQYLIKKAIEIKSFEELSKLDWVDGRYNYKLYCQKKWKEVIGKYIKYEDNIIIVDTRHAEEFIPRSGSWELYIMYQDAKVSIHITQNVHDETLVSLSENLFNKKSNNVNLGEIAARYRGGGHHGAAGFSLEPANADKIIKEVINEIKEANK